MQRSSKTSLALVALALPLAIAASACLEDEGTDRIEDKDGVNEVPPPSGANGANGANGAAVGPSAVAVGATIAVSSSASGDGGAGQGGDGGAGGAAGTGGAGGAGGGASSGGAAITCAEAGFGAAFVDAQECINPTNLSAITSNFTLAVGAPVTPAGCVAGSVGVVEADGQLSVAPGADPECFGRTAIGQMRGCSVEADITMPAGGSFSSATFGVRDLDDPNADEADWGTISVEVREGGGGLFSIEAQRFGPVGADPAPVDTVLGLREGETAVPLRVFVANPAGSDVTCAGIVKGASQYLCIGCWSGDVHTNQVLDGGAMVFQSGGTDARFDELN